MPSANKTVVERLANTRAYIAHIETGLKTSSLETMEKIANALKVSVKDLF